MSNRSSIYTNDENQVRTTLFPLCDCNSIMFFYTGTSFKLACIGSSLLCDFLFRMLQATSQNPDPLYMVKKRLELHYYDRNYNFFIMLQ